MILGYDFIMKNKYFIIIVILITAAAFGSCGKKGETNELFPADSVNFDKEASYALGTLYGEDIAYMLTSNEWIPHIDEVLKGMADVLKGKERQYTVDEAYEIFNSAVTAILDKQNEIMEEQNELLKQEENIFLAENAKKPGINITSSGLQYEIIREGTGPKPEATNLVQVHYEGTLTDGTVFDSSYSRGSPLEFYLDRVISGWTEGLQLMSVGSEYNLYIPSDLGYGPNGAGSIPPFSTLIFRVELLDIVN